MDPGGNFLLVANFGSNNVRVNLDNGAITQVAGSPFPARTFPISVTVDAAGPYVYVANEGSNNVTTYQMNTSTGALIPLARPVNRTGIQPRSITTAVQP